MTQEPSKIITIKGDLRTGEEKMSKFWITVMR